MITVPIIARECEKTPARLQGVLTRSFLTRDRLWSETSLFFYSDVMPAMVSLTLETRG